MKITLNDTVRVKLRVWAKDLLHETWKARGVPDPHCRVREDADGWSTWPLWELMMEMGSMVTGTAPFEEEMVLEGSKPRGEYRPQQRHLQVELWTINRWLRWTGLRLFVNLPDRPGVEPTSIGIMWTGLPGSSGWRRMEGEPPNEVG